MIGARRVEARQRAGRGGPRERLAEGRDLVEGVGAVGRDDALDAQGLVLAEVGVDEDAGVQQGAEPLVQGDEGGEGAPLGLGLGTGRRRTLGP